MKSKRDFCPFIERPLHLKLTLQNVHKYIIKGHKSHKSFEDKHLNLYSHINTDQHTLYKAYHDTAYRIW